MSNAYDALNDDPPAPDVRGTQVANAEETAKADKLFLMQQPQFIRWLLTMREKAGIDAVSYQMQPTDLAYAHGRRTLGLELLGDLRLLEPRLDLVLAAEKSQTLEPVNDRRSRTR